MSTYNQVANELENMSIGYTKIVNGHVVTRYAFDQYEIGTYGQNTINQYGAVLMLLN